MIPAAPEIFQHGRDHGSRRKPPDAMAGRRQ
jgi:hypothetical protein